MSREIEVNVRIAVEVFGEDKPEGQPVVTGHISQSTLIESYPWKAWIPALVVTEEWVWAPRPFMTEIADAWLVVEKMRRSEADLLGRGGMELELSCMPLGASAYPPNAQWLAGFHDDGPIYQQWGATAPEAICLAALKAVNSPV